MIASAKKKQVKYQRNEDCDSDTDINNSDISVAAVHALDLERCNFHCWSNEPGWFPKISRILSIEQINVSRKLITETIDDALRFYPPEPTKTKPKDIAPCLSQVYLRFP